MAGYNSNWLRAPDALSDDIYFIPDDTHYIGYDTGSSTYLRPREIAFTRKLISDYAHAIGTTPAETNGFILRNSSPGAGGTAQYSPSIFLAGRDEADDEVIFRNEVQPQATDGNLVWSASVGGGAYAAAMTLTSAGAVMFADAASATTYTATSNSGLVIGGQYYAYANTAAWNTGLTLNTTGLRSIASNVTMAFVNAGTTDAASAVVAATVYDRNAASITNASTMRIHSFGWTNNADAYTELAAVYGDGTIKSAALNSTSTVVSTSHMYCGGSYWFDSGGYGIARSGTYALGFTPGSALVESHASRPTTLLQRGLTDAASAIVAATVYDRNAASITNAATMRIHSFGWTDNVDAYNELAYVRADGAFVLTDTSSATIEGQEADSGTAIGLLVNTANAFTTSGAKLLSVQNNSSEKAYIDKDGALALNDQLYFGTAFDADSPPTALGTGAVGYFSNGDGGSECLAVSVSGTWYRVALGAAVASS